MGEHKHNPVAMAAAGNRLGAEVLLAFSAKPHVLVIPGERIREVDGQTEVMGVPPKVDEDGSIAQGDGPQVWHVPPTGLEVYPEGSQLPMEKLDVTVNLVATATGGMLSADGRVVGRRRHLQELYREDAQTFLATMGGGPAVSPS